MERRSFMATMPFAVAAFADAKPVSAASVLTSSMKDNLNLSFFLDEKILQKAQERSLSEFDGNEISLAFEKAAEWASSREGSVLEVGNGDYPIVRPVKIGNKLSIVGSGSAQTRFIPTSDFTCFELESIYGKALGRAGIRNLMIYFKGNTGSWSKGNGIRIRAVDGPIWKPFIQDVQMYQVPNAGISLAGTSQHYVAETYIRNVEIAKCRFGLLDESYYVYDTFAEMLYVDGASQFGVSLKGGSNTFIHTHCVACGNSKAGGQAQGGGFNIRTNNNSFFDCHADRSIGDGFVIGGFGTENPMMNNRLVACFSFNSGAGVAANAAAYRFGKVAHTKLMGCYAGKIGAKFAESVYDGFLFASPDVNAVELVGCSAKDTRNAGFTIPAAAKPGAISLVGCDYEGTGTPIVNADLATIMAGNLGKQSLHGETSLSGEAEVKLVGAKLALPGNASVIRLFGEAALETISGGRANTMLFLRKRADVPAVTVRNAKGNINLSRGSDVVLANESSLLVLVKNADGSWSNSL